MRKTILEVKDLNVAFSTVAGAVYAVRGVSFDLAAGETLAIVGESGSGKSVTTKAIIGLLAENAETVTGEINFTADFSHEEDGSEEETADLLQMSDMQLQNKIRGNKISMIFQDPMTSLNPCMQVGKQIIEAITENRDVSKHDAKIEALELLKLVGIEDAEKRFNQYPHQYSGGMRQRVVIAIALSCQPDILICDEPTTALDVTIQAQILDLINELQAKTGVAVIFITHDLGVVANVADRVAVMYAGKIVEIGTSNEIFYHPQHPYTWGLIASMPDLESKGKGLYNIPGTPPNMVKPPKGDAFSIRSDYALAIDREEQPPMFDVTDTHSAATWLLHEYAPEVTPPEVIQRRFKVYEGLVKEAKKNG